VTLTADSHGRALRRAVSIKPSGPPVFGERLSTIPIDLTISPSRHPTPPSIPRNSSYGVRCFAAASLRTETDGVTLCLGHRTSAPRSPPAGRRLALSATTLGQVTPVAKSTPTRATSRARRPSATTTWSTSHINGPVVWDRLLKPAHFTHGKTLTQ